MLDLTKCDPALLQLPDAVVTALLAQSTALRAQNVMIVGAHCRDILRSASGQQSGLRTTEDIDFGLALADWASFSGGTSPRSSAAARPSSLKPGQARGQTRSTSR